MPSTPGPRPEGPVTDHLAKLEAGYGHPVLLYGVDIGDESVPVLYECLRAIGRTERLGVVLSTSGGEITTTRRIVLLLREFASELVVLVPYRARSAGTLLCLGADEIAMGSMSELGPTDANMASLSPPSDSPNTVSSEDVRLFSRMAEEWFGVTSEQDRIQVLALIAQRMFPASLTALYRFDKLARQIAHELLGYHLSDTGNTRRDGIVDTLVGGQFSHERTIFRHEAKSLGLNVRLIGAEEERRLWDLQQAFQGEMLDQPGRAGEEGVTGIIACTALCARRMQRNDPGSYSAERNETGPPRMRRTWEM